MSGGSIFRSKPPQSQTRGMLSAPLDSKFHANKIQIPRIRVFSRIVEFVILIHFHRPCILFGKLLDVIKLLHE